MMTASALPSLLAASLLLLAPAAVTGEAPAFRPGLALDDADRVVLTSYIAHAIAQADGLTPAKLAERCAESPEMFAWVEFPGLDCLLDAYELTGDTAHLDRFLAAFARFEALLQPCSDGHPGWLGKPIPPRRKADLPDLRIDELQMNFRAIAILARWVRLARLQADYHQVHAADAERFVALMQRHLFPKWDERGFFVDLGAEGGVYRGLDYPLCNPETPGTTLSFEKLSIVVDGLIQLHLATAQDDCLRRAILIGTRFKRCLSLQDGCYAWMSWDPAGAWDADPVKQAWRIGWIAPDPKGEWYAAAVSIAVRLHRLGLVFDDADMQRFIATQRTRCWNGDLDRPVYRTVAGAEVGSSKHITGRFLSYDLATMDPLLDRLAFAGPHQAEVLANTGNAWKGGTALRAYVRGKYLDRDRAMETAAGAAFLAREGNRAFHDRLRFDVIAPGRATPLKPSQLLVPPGG